jgi:hypothetical protein
MLVSTIMMYQLDDCSGKRHPVQFPLEVQPILARRRLEGRASMGFISINRP